VSGPSRSPATDGETLGLAHVATASFVGARIAPAAQFWLTLPGGVAIAQASRRRGLSPGFGASLAATLQGVAILGPLRVTVPVTQALSAPLLGALERRGRGIAPQFAVTLAIRLLIYTALNALWVWLVVGSIDGLVRTYDATTGWLGVLPQGRTAALVLTFGWQLIWGVVLSVVQVAVYRRALRRWPEAPPAVERRPAAAATVAETARDPRPLALAALVAFVLLLASTAPLVLAGVSAWLACAWLLARPEPRTARFGAALAGLLAVSALVAGLLADLGAAATVERAVRAALLVLVATWLRGASGPEGMRALFGGVLRRMARVGWAREAGALLARLDSADQLTAAGRSLIDELRHVEHKPGPVADAATRWVVAEAARGAVGRPRVEARLLPRRADRAVMVLAVLPVVGLVGHAVG
jgi:hypothetical protein